MSEAPRGFRHQHGDPRGLRERIDAQLRDRLEEALEMAALELLVALRQKEGRSAPDEASAADREAWRALTGDVLAAVRDGVAAALGPDDREALALAEARSPGDARARALAGQVALARRLPDYWQQVDRERAAYLARRLNEPPPPSGWLRRLFAG